MTQMIYTKCHQLFLGTRRATGQPEGGDRRPGRARRSRGDNKIENPRNHKLEILPKTPLGGYENRVSMVIVLMLLLWPPTRRSPSGAAWTQRVGAQLQHIPNTIEIIAHI